MRAEDESPATMRSLSKIVVVSFGRNLLLYGHNFSSRRLLLNLLAFSVFEKLELFGSIKSAGLKIHLQRFMELTAITRMVPHVSSVNRGLTCISLHENRKFQFPHKPHLKIQIICWNF